jgi:HD-GYP domain-containing protein (c-di-GMP phosphodiesterase class II)
MPEQNHGLIEQEILGEFSGDESLSLQIPRALRRVTGYMNAAEANLVLVSPQGRVRQVFDTTALHWRINSREIQQLEELLLKNAVPQEMVKIESTGIVDLIAPIHQHNQSDCIAYLVVHGVRGSRGEGGAQITSRTASCRDALRLATVNAHLTYNLRDTYLKSTEVLAMALEAKDEYTRGHSNLVMAHCMTIAEQMKMPEEQRQKLSIGALLHDIGKIGVLDAVLNKPGRLTDEEYDQIKQHPRLGVQILKPLVPDFLDLEVLDCVLLHHERLDGKGYPEGLSGDEIPFLPRIVSVADAFDAMTSLRPYREPVSPAEAIEELERCSGTQFDSEIVQSLKSAFHL